MDETPGDERWSVRLLLLFAHWRKLYGYAAVGRNLYGCGACVACRYAIKKRSTRRTSRTVMSPTPPSPYVHMSRMVSVTDHTRIWVSSCTSQGLVMYGHVTYPGRKKIFHSSDRLVEQAHPALGSSKHMSNPSSHNITPPISGDQH